MIRTRSYLGGTKKHCLMMIKQPLLLYCQMVLGTSSIRSKIMSHEVCPAKRLLRRDTNSGIALHDVRFKGERIVYELGMQEALAHYAGLGAEETFASYLDVNIGFTDFNLIPGYDCPAYATYTDSFCLFEYPKDFPMNRHQDTDYYHATKNIAFLVRSVSTVGNYDYQTTYEFYYDGSIQVLVRASGYIQGSDLVNTTDAWDYGFHIRDQLSGAMHDHVLNFKLDLDVHGTQNSLFKTEFVPHSQVYPWSKGQMVNTMKVERSFIENEDQGKNQLGPECGGLVCGRKQG